MKKKKWFGVMGLSFGSLMASASTASAQTIGKDIYNGTGGISQIDTLGKNALKIVGGFGMTAFVLAFMIIGLCIGLMSLSPQATSKMWKAFFICLGAAVLFFSAYLFPTQIQGWITPNTP